MFQDVLMLSILLRLTSGAFAIPRTGHAEFQFDEHTKLANGTFSCDNVDESLDILSVDYASHNCQSSCSRFPARSDYFVGSDVACQNENHIRSVCDAKTSCSFHDMLQPEKPCLDGNWLAYIRVTYRCIRQQYTFNICSQQTAIVEQETPIIFYTPRTKIAGSSCICSVQSTTDDQMLKLNITRKRMAQLRTGEEIYYEYFRSGKVRNIRVKDSVTYDTVYLPDENIISSEKYDALKITISFRSQQPLKGNSRMFLRVEPGDNLVVECDNIKPKLTALAQPALDLLDYYKTRANNSETMLMIVIAICGVAVAVAVVLGILLCCSKRNAHGAGASDRTSTEGTAGNRAYELPSGTGTYERVYSRLQRGPKVNGANRNREQAMPLATASTTQSNDGAYEKLLVSRAEDPYSKLVIRPNSRNKTKKIIEKTTST